MVAARIKASGAEKLLAKLKEQAERAKNLAPVLEPAAQAIKTFIDDSFRRSSSPDGKSWEPLAKATTDKRRKGSSKPLIDTGYLRSSAYARLENPTTIVFGDNAEYAGTHQYGAEITGTYGDGSRARKRHGPRAPKKRKRPKLGPQVVRTGGYSAQIGPNPRKQAKTGSYSFNIPARPFLPVIGDAIQLIGPIAKIGPQILEYIRTGKLPGK